MAVLGTRTRLLGIVAAVALAATGCGGGEGDGGGGTDGGGPVTLRVVSNWTGSEGEAFQSVIDTFEQQNPDITVEIEQVPFDQTQALLTQQFVQGNPPDVAVALPGIVRNFGEQGLLLDLSEQWDTWVSEGAYNESLRDVAAAGLDTVQSVYFKGNVNGLMWYDPAQLEQAGLAVPATWDEFVAGMTRAASQGVAPVVVGAKDGWPLTQWADPIILGTAGPDKFNQLSRGEIGWDDPAIVASFQNYADIAEQFFPPDALGLGFIDATCSRAAGEFLYQNQGAFISLIVPSECGEQYVPGEDFTFFPMPRPDASAPAAQAVSGDLFIGAKDTAHEEATRALLSYLGSADAQTVWAQVGGYIAPNALVPLSAYPTELDRRAAELWPREADQAAGYDLDDWIGGEIQTVYRQGLEQLIRDYDVAAFIDTMTAVDTRAGG